MPLAAESSQLLIVDITLRTLLRAVGRGRHFESKIIRFVFLFMSIFRRQDESRAGEGLEGLEELHRRCSLYFGICGNPRTQGSQATPTITLNTDDACYIPTIASITSCFPHFSLHLLVPSSPRRDHHDSQVWWSMGDPRETLGTPSSFLPLLRLSLPLPLPLQLSLALPPLLSLSCDK